MVCITAMDQLSEEDVRIMASVVGATGKRAGEAERAAQWPCPRCDSADTKFCYYNNYNLSQPRHFCKGCRRYWTRGGALRNVPVGGGTRKPTPSGAVSRRKNRPSQPHAAPVLQLQHSVSSPLPLLPSVIAPQPPPPPQLYELSFVSTLAAMDPDRRLLDLGGNFSTLIAPPAPVLPYGHFATGFLFGGAANAGPSHAHAPAFQPQQPPVVSQAVPEGFFLGMGWPDLSI